MGKAFAASKKANAKTKRNAGAKLSIQDAVEYTSMMKCPRCPNNNALANKGEVITALVWTGALFETVQHGRKRCKKCGTSFRLNFYWDNESGHKINTLDIRRLSRDDNPIFLLQNGFGVRLKYLELLYNRVFRSAEAMQAEATSIAMTFPDQKMPGGNDTELSRWLVSAFFSYLRMREGKLIFAIDDPVPSDDKEYGASNTGIHTIFDAYKHDPSYAKECLKKIDVATDGNLILTRECADKSELSLKKRGAGRPAMKKQHNQKKVDVTWWLAKS